MYTYAYTQNIQQTVKTTDECTVYMYAYTQNIHVHALRITRTLSFVKSFDICLFTDFEGVEDFFSRGEATSCLNGLGEDCGCGNTTIGSLS